MRYPVTMLEPHRQVRRILALVQRATLMEHIEGMGWYFAANRFAQELAKAHDITVEQAAGIIAALSPQVSWDINKQLARRLCEGKRLSNQTKVNIDKAKAIFKGGNPEVILGQRKRTGKKVRAFYACIVDPHNSNAVCVDRHAFSLAGGIFASDDNARNNILRRNGVYENLAGSYRKAADMLGIKAHQAQAIAWVVWRNLKSEINPVLTEAQVA